MTDINRHSAEIISILKQHYQKVKCGLNYSSPLELLVATILSAQCTDERVNMVTPILFKKYKTAAALARAELAVLAEIIKPVGLYKNKAKSIIGCCQKLVTEFKGEVPRTLPEMTSLPGVGRKTANVVLGNAFNIASGIAVDTHVKRVSCRLGLTEQSDPVKIEQELMKIFNKKEWIWVNHALIAHGRTRCKARTPLCAECPLSGYCLFFKNR